MPSAANGLCTELQTKSGWKATLCLHRSQPGWGGGLSHLLPGRPAPPGLESQKSKLRAEDGEVQAGRFCLTWSPLPARLHLLCRPRSPRLAQHSTYSAFPFLLLFSFPPAFFLLLLGLCLHRTQFKVKNMIRTPNQPMSLNKGTWSFTHSRMCDWPICL